MKSWSLWDTHDVWTEFHEMFGQRSPCTCWPTESPGCMVELFLVNKKRARPNVLQSPGTPEVFQAMKKVPQKGVAYTTKSLVTYWVTSSLFFRWHVVGPKSRFCVTFLSLWIFWALRELWPERREAFANGTPTGSQQCSRKHLVRENCQTQPLGDMEHWAFLLGRPLKRSFLLPSLSRCAGHNECTVWQQGLMTVSAQVWVRLSVHQTPEKYSHPRIFAPITTTTRSNKLAKTHPPKPWSWQQISCRGLCLDWKRLPSGCFHGLHVWHLFYAYHTISVPKLLRKWFVLDFWDAKMTLRCQKLILPKAQVARNGCTEITQIPYKNYGAQ